MAEEKNPSKGRGNPGGSQSGGKNQDQSAEDLKKQSQKDKEKRKDEKGNYIEKPHKKKE
ncbi:MAG: hypothetical protein WBL27_10835 [Salinimicrobium sp.]